MVRPGVKNRTDGVPKALDDHYEYHPSDAPGSNDEDYAHGPLASIDQAELAWHYG